MQRKKVFGALARGVHKNKRFLCLVQSGDSTQTLFPRDTTMCVLARSCLFFICEDKSECREAVLLES